MPLDGASSIYGGEVVLRKMILQSSGVESMVVDAPLSYSSVITTQSRGFFLVVRNTRRLD
jgi:hypothetical protein